MNSKPKWEPHQRSCGLFFLSDPAASRNLNAARQCQSNAVPVKKNVDMQMIIIIINAVR